VTGQDLSKLRAVEGQGCPACGGKVFTAERAATRAGVFHSACLACSTCNKALDVTSLVEREGRIYCSGCYRRESQARAKSVGPGDTSAIKAESSGESCPRCGGAVFQAERVGSRKHFYHKGCLSCLHCRKPLGPGSLADGPDDEVYCRACYAVLFMRSKSLGPADRTAIKPASGQEACRACGGKVGSCDIPQPCPGV
jgi:DNA-directed RNA polymerase subunit RPC12/RpoP